MTRRLRFVLLALILGCSYLACAQRSSEAMSGKTELYVYVTFLDQKPVKPGYKVVLLTSTRMMVSQDMTNDRGQAIFRGVGPGEYRVVVTGLDIDEAEIRVTVESHGGFDSTQNEHIEVRQSGNHTGASNQASVSVKTLTIPDDARKEFEKGLASLDQRDVNAARQHLTKAVELYPQYCGAFLDLGVIAMQEKHPDEGKRYFERAVEADPKNPAAYLYLASARMLDNDFKAAEDLLLKALVIIPTDPEPLTMLASCQLKLGELNQAVATARRVHEVPHPRHAIAHFIAAQALLKESQPQPAAAELKLFLQEAPNAPQAAAAKSMLASIEQPK
jgi:tetratricopeptide (TPR) repeat protein